MPEEPLIREATKAAIHFAAGYLAGSADKRFGTKTKWTMMVYMALESGKYDPMQYLERLEKTLRRRWPEGETPPSIADVWKDKSKPVLTL